MRHQFSETCSFHKPDCDLIFCWKSMTEKYSKRKYFVVSSCVLFNDSYQSALPEKLSEFDIYWLIWILNIDNFVHSQIWTYWLSSCLYIALYQLKTKVDIEMKKVILYDLFLSLSDLFLLYIHRRWGKNFH